MGSRLYSRAANELTARRPIRAAGIPGLIPEVPLRVALPVFPVAGWVTAFPPATKAHPKDMLPLVDTPVILCVLEEAVSACSEPLIIASSTQNQATDDHFD